MNLVPGGAIEKYVNAHSLIVLSNELGEDNGNIAKAYTSAGMVVWTKQDGQVRFYPTGSAPVAWKRTMYDAVNWSAIPTNAEIVAGYIDGRFVWPQAAWDRFPNAARVRIAVFATTLDGDVLDMEWGDSTPQQCPGWIQARQAAGLLVPTIYTEASRVGEVQTACASLTYDLWVADWNNYPHIPAVAVACQWTHPPFSGGDFDVSLCREGWPRS